MSQRLRISAHSANITTDITWKQKLEGVHHENMRTDLVYRCRKCNEDIYFDHKYQSKGGVHIPMDPDTGKYHRCKSTVHKRKGILKVLTRTQLEYYKMLELYPGATVAEIENAFNYVIKQWHPDRWAQTPTSLQKQAKKRYDEIIEAHNNIRLISVKDE